VPLGVRLSHPDWLVERWLRQLGPELMTAALDADQQPASLALLAAVTDCAAIAAAGGELVPHPWATGVVVVRAGAGSAIKALQAGRGYALDATATVVARLLPEADRIIDLTAAPGGKSAVLASERPTTRLVASDRHLGRVVLMRGNLAHAGSQVAVIAADATCPPFAPASVAAVLLDAPCSGTGTLRRHPEIRWRLQPEALATLADAQRKLIAAAAELLAPGGCLLYSTCSLEPEENAEVVATVPLRVLPIADRLPEAVPRVLLASGGVVIPPSAHGDGFTVHLLKKSA
jgi:16S rRNA (cytosine967-C5)-methyltransferase